jgi:hypothetical protein
MNDYELYARTLAKVEQLEEELEENKRHLRLSWKATKQDIKSHSRGQMITASYALHKINKISQEAIDLINNENGNE